MGAPGFDDAPIAILSRGVAKTVHFVYPYYENANFLRFQLDAWRAYPEALRKHLRAIIVDDGSPESPARDVLITETSFPFPIRLFRIMVDVRWNWLAARNIAMHHAPSGWTLLTDMDHVVPSETLDSLVHDLHDPQRIYRLSRIEYSGATIHSHPNSMFMTREMFWKAGGYDEALSGFYGTDGDWRRRCAATATVETLPDVLIRHEHVQDSSTTRYLRKQPEDAGKKAIIAKRQKGWRPRVLSFPYQEVEL